MKSCKTFHFNSINYIKYGDCATKKIQNSNPTNVIWSGKMQFLNRYMCTHPSINQAKWKLPNKCDLLKIESRDWLAITYRINISFHHFTQMHTKVNYDFHLIQNKQVINQSRCRIWIKTGLIEWHRLDDTSD